MPVGGSGRDHQGQRVAADLERLVLIDAISRAVEAIPTERPMVVVLDDDPEPDPSSPLVLRVFPLGLAPTDDSPAPSLQPTLVRDGEHVTITWHDEVVRTKSSKGIEYLARLLVAPDQELHVLTVASPAGRSVKQADPVLHIANDDAGPLLDAQAKEAYRKRIRDLQEEIDEAESFNDPMRASLAREELAFIADHLSEALGLGGRDRRSTSNTERARVNVTKRIKNTIEKITSEAPKLGRHLEATIKTGTYLSYSTISEPTMVWRIDLR